MKLIKSIIHNLPFTEKGQLIYWDDDLAGFGICIGSRTKTWCVQQRVYGRTRRVKLGVYPAMTSEQARIAAKEAIGRLASGIDITQAERASKTKSITLDRVFDSFLKDRNLKPKTIKDYTQVMNNIYSDWLRMPIADITRDAVLNRHQQTGLERGEAYANLSSRILRSVLNYAAAKYENGDGGVSVLFSNPVDKISQTRSWYKVNRRTGYIKQHELKSWFDAVLAIDNPTIRDYLLFAVLSGCRKVELSKLRWADIDLIEKSYILRDTKNGLTIRLPVSDYLVTMLNARKLINAGSLFVFEGTGKNGYLVEPRQQVKKVTEKSCIHFTMHDLRRTFITIAESLDISSFALKALVNHKQGSDVTSGYVQISVDRLQQPMQQITDTILTLAGLR